MATTPMDRLETLVNFFEHITPADLPRFRDFYSTDAYFKDPFNEVRGVDKIRSIFAHMFEAVEQPRFAVHGRFLSEDGAMLLWDFHFRQGREPRTIRGTTHLRFDPAGKVSYHRDYWDAAEEAYEKFPVLGPLLRALRRRMAA